MRRGRHIEEAFFKLLMRLSTLIVAGSLCLILYTIISKGLPAMSVSMVTQTTKAAFYPGKAGGVLNAILGSLVLALGATLFAAILAFPIVLYLNIYSGSNSRLATYVRFSFDVLFGIPSIIYGAFGFMIMLYFGIRASLLGGIIAVGLLELPVIARAIDEIMRMIPVELKEASYSLGATKLETGIKVIMKQALPGILTGILIGLGRGIGDAASVMFTAGWTDNLPKSFMKPIGTLPIAIYSLLIMPFPAVRERAYASAFILTALILTLSITARILSRRFSKHILK
jgi:phosphate transport system permease protein